MEIGGLIYIVTENIRPPVYLRNALDIRPYITRKSINNYPKPTSSKFILPRSNLTAPSTPNL